MDLINIISENIVQIKTMLLIGGCLMSKSHKYLERFGDVCEDFEHFVKSIYFISWIKDFEPSVLHLISHQIGVSDLNKKKA